jgi:hypothetical protein
MLRVSVSGYDNKNISFTIEYNDTTANFHLVMAFYGIDREWNVMNKDLAKGLLSMILMTSEDILNVTLNYIAPTLEYDQLHPVLSKVVQQLVSPSE